jgi:hypothetical protein
MMGRFMIKTQKKKSGIDDDENEEDPMELHQVSSKEEYKLTSMSMDREDFNDKPIISARLPW